MSTTEQDLPGTAATSATDARTDELADEALARRSTQISHALEVAAERIPAEAQEQARTDLDRVQRRLRLGVGHTVVALVGGTGSGKSSLFNAVSGLDFADVGVIRPTTAEAAACVWGEPAADLLDFLGVSQNRRIQRESALDADREEDLSGLVLLDLPDHDSVEHGHARQVDRLLPLVDLLIWVVDPQKYADNALHESYLRSLATRQEAMVVVINQMDTLPEHTRASVRDDVARLLEQDGLDQVQIMLTSARQREGIAELRERIGEVTATASVSARTARSQLEAAATALRAHVAPTQPEPDDAETTAEQLTVASGVSSVAESVRTAVASPREVALSAVQRPARSRIDAIRDRWLAKATAELPEPWVVAATADVPDASTFAEHVWAALQKVPLPAGRDDAGQRLRRIGQLVLGLGIVAVLAGAALVVLNILDVLSTTVGWPVAGVGVVAIAVGIGVNFLAGRSRRRAATERSESYLATVTHELRSVVATDLIEPVAPVLADHEQARRGIQNG